MAAFSPVMSNKLYIQIHNQIKDAILNGTYKPGDKLPSEKELCQIFNVSRVPVREALCALELNGLVDSVQGGGVYVRNWQKSEDDPLPQIEPEEIIRVRMLLEPAIVRQAAHNLDEESRKELEAILVTMRKESANGPISRATDNAFYWAVGKACGSPLCSSIMEIVFKAMDQTLWSLLAGKILSTKKSTDRINREHIKIAEAILAGQEEEAEKLMAEHLKQFHEAIQGGEE